MDGVPQGGRFGQRATFGRHSYFYTGERERHPPFLSLEILGAGQCGITSCRQRHPATLNLDCGQRATFGGVGLTPQILLMDALEDKTPDEAEEDVGRPGGDERREGAGVPHGDGDGKDYPIDEADDEADSHPLSNPATAPVARR